MSNVLHVIVAQRPGLSVVIKTWVCCFYGLSSHA